MCLSKKYYVVFGDIKYCVLAESAIDACKRTFKYWGETSEDDSFVPCYFFVSEIGFHARPGDLVFTLEKVLQYTLEKSDDSK